MKLESIEMAAAHYNNWECEQNTDVRIPNNYVERAYKEYLNSKNISSDEARLFNSIMHRFHHHIQTELSIARFNVMQKFLNDVAKAMDDAGEPQATSVFELAAKLEV